MRPYKERHLFRKQPEQTINLSDHLPIDFVVPYPESPKATIMDRFHTSGDAVKKSEYLLVELLKLKQSIATDVLTLPPDDPISRHVVEINSTIERTRVFIGFLMGIKRKKIHLECHIEGGMLVVRPVNPRSIAG